MAKKGYKISSEIKQQIINRIKNEGVSPGTIYNWLGTKAKGVVSLLAHNKIRKENDQLKQIIGELTIKLSMEAKRGHREAKGGRNQAWYLEVPSILSSQATTEGLEHQTVNRNYTSRTSQLWPQTTSHTSEHEQEKSSAGHEAEIRETPWVAIVRFAQFSSLETIILVSESSENQAVGSHHLKALYSNTF